MQKLYDLILLFEKDNSELGQYLQDYFEVMAKRRRLTLPVTVLIFQIYVIDAAFTPSPHGSNRSPLTFSRALKPENSFHSSNEAIFRYQSQSTIRSSYFFPLNSRKKTSTTMSVDTTEDGISDVDARVLQSMLRESKLDLKTEDDVRKLLERGTVKNAPSFSDKLNDNEDDDSGFSSAILKTLSDTKLWRSLQAKSSEVLESVGIWVTNRVEQDVKVLAALGLFAWDRAVRDVARSLPEARQQVQRATVFLLSNSSSFDKEDFQKQEIEWKRKKTLDLELNKPVDEIKSVSREVISILSGQKSSGFGSTGRGLRTTAPAGSINSGERQRRAFVQSQKISKEKKDITKVPGNIIDSAWELKRELKAERNIPGYKTEPIRKAIAAAAVGTGNLLREASIEARLAASKRRESRLLKESSVAAKLIFDVPIDKASFTTEVSEVDTFVEVGAQNVAIPAGSTQRNTQSATNEKYLENLIYTMQSEVETLSDRLNQCIQLPGDTWLCGYGNDSPSSIKRLREVVTKMIVVRNRAETETVKPFTTSNAVIRLNDLFELRDSIKDLCSLTETAVSSNVGDSLQTYLFHGDSNTREAEGPLLLRLDEFSDELRAAQTVETDLVDTSKTFDSIDFNTNVFFAQAQKVDLNPAPLDSAWSAPPKYVKTSSEIPTEDTTIFSSFQNKESFSNSNKQSSNLEQSTIYMDAITESEALDGISQIPLTIPSVDEVYTYQPDEDKIRILMAEVISDDDFDKVFESTKQTKAVSDDDFEKENEKVEENLIAQVTLRSLDILFFILEKFLTVGVPATIIVVKTVIARLEAAKNEGKGRKGWQNFEKLAKNAKGRY